MRTKTIQHELPVACEAFNLAGQTGVDVDKLLESSRSEIAREAAAHEFARKMQRTLNECPGVVGFELAASGAVPSKVVIEPAKVNAAVEWLKRRVIINPDFTLSKSGGLTVEFLPGKQGNRRSGQRMAVRWKVEQFEFALA
jgi:hypothetical protein